LNTHLVKNYFKHFFTAKNEHSIHSPFVFEFYNQCIKSKSQFYSFKTIEAQRKLLLQSAKLVEINDLGARSIVNKNKQRKIKDIAANSLKPPFLGQQLFRIINHLQPQTIIEVGTSLGITTSYLASPFPQTTVTTLEGCSNTASIAKQTFQNLQVQNITQIQGDFKNTLPTLANKSPKIDFVFFDGNHQYQATLDYFTTCKEKANENTCFVFDDIYWSKGMTKAWEEIKKDPQVMISIDTFYFGICFFRTNQPKQHFTLR